jgi:RNase H-like domain found in reverse transcriptase
VSWNGLVFDFENRGIAAMAHRIARIKESLSTLLVNWPKVTFRDVAQFLGQLNSLHPVLEGLATLRSKMLQTIVNIRHFHGYNWEAVIVVNSPPLLSKAKYELQYWLVNIDAKNFRLFEAQVPSCCGWVDASDHAIGGVLVRLAQPVAANIPVTMDNWLLDGAGLLPKIRNCASLQVGGEEQVPSLVTSHDLDPAVVRDMYIVHRNLQYIEMAVDSNERELLAAVELISACAELLQNSSFTLHFDNMNAAIICAKESSKFRLQGYATRIADLCEKYSIKLAPVWIPRCLNNFADKYSKMLDYEDYAITDQFFHFMQQTTGFVPNIDRFANNWNAKCELFNSASFCIGTSGVDAFQYSWGPPTKNWIFPPPRLLARALLYLEQCKGEGVFLVPQWKGAPFYDLFKDWLGSNQLQGRWCLPGSNVFVRGADATTCFGPDFSGTIELWYLNFNTLFT